MSRKLLLSILLFTAIHNSKGQTYSGVAAQKIYSKASLIEYEVLSESPVFITWNSSSNVAVQFAFMELKPLLKMNTSTDSWKEFRSETDETGITHTRYMQLYKSLKVEGGEYILHSKNGRLLKANGYFYNGINLNTTPALSEKAALQKALNDIDASVYKWQVSTEENWLKESENNPKATYYPKGELVIVKLKNVKERTFRLAWKFDVYAHEPMSRNVVYIDAQNGRVIEKIDRICEFISTGTAVTMYNGTRQIKTDSLSATSFRLRDYSRGANIETYDMNHGTSYGASVDFTDTDNYWNTTTDQDHAAYDAHFGAQMTWDYYWNSHNRNSYNGTGSPLKSYVHYSNNYNNAFWNGSVMTYGDGNGSTFSPLTQLDVCGHELSHGVTEYTSGLVYAYESGALNESFSDIFGTCVEFYANGGTGNWLVGEQCYTPGTSGDALRYMNNPNLAADPDTYLGTYWYSGTGDNGGVHTNSGVQNFWFYLLSAGGSGTNDVGFAYNVSGLGITDAGKIAYRTNAYYLTTASQYADARRYSITAAADLFGPCSNQMIQTANAWDAVGVTGYFSPNPLAQASNSGVVCEGGNVNLISSGGATFSWTGPGGFSSSLQNPVLTNIAFAAAGNYAVTVTDVNGCSGTVTTKVKVNQKPSITAASGQATICRGATVNLSSAGTAYGTGNPFTTINTQRISIPDANTTGIQSPITVSGSSGLANEIAWIQIDSISHTWDADLKLILIAPNNSQITLADGVGGSGDGFSKTIFSSASLNTIGSNGYNTAPFNGTYAPQQPFSNLTGSANGIWKLKIVDAYSQDTGSVWGWKIAVPGPNAITTYSWTPSGLLTTSTAQNTIATVNTNTTYTVTVSDLKGCTNTATVSVAVFPELTATTTRTNLNCYGSNNGEIIVNALTGAPPFQYAIDGSAFQSSNTFTGLPAGPHSIQVTDVNQCSILNLSDTLFSPAYLSFFSISNNPVCYGNTNGSIDASVSGGIAPYNYLWNDGSTLLDRNNLPAGIYSITITDANNCTSQSAISLYDPAAVNVVDSITEINCNGQSTGAISIEGIGGSGIYSFMWNDGSTLNSKSGLAAGTYSVTVSDDLGCSNSAQIILLQPAAIAISNTTSEVTCNGFNNGSVNPTASGGTGLFTFLWNNGSTLQSALNLAPGTYTVTVTDQNNCTQTSSANITEPSILSGTTTTYDVLCFGSNTGSINTSASGGIAPYNYFWNTGSNAQNLSSLTSGTYSVTITDANGCSAQETSVITQPSQIVISSTKVSVRCGGKNTGSINTSITGGIAPYQYLWNNGQTTSAISSLYAGTYTVTVTDANGCSKTKALIITQNPTLSLIVFAIGNNGIASTSGGVPPYDYLWNTVPAQTTSTATGLTPGKYKVTVTDFKNCKRTGSIIITASKTEVESAPSIDVYPNPNSGQFNVVINNGNPSETQLILINSLGERILLIKETSSEETFFSIDVSFLSKGVYVIEAERNGNSEFRKVVVF